MTIAAAPLGAVGAGDGQATTTATFEAVQKVVARFDWGAHREQPNRRSTICV